MSTNFKILLILSIILTVFACNKEADYQGEGILTGYDPRDCACCGGLLINLNSGETDLFTDSTYQVDLVPEDFDINSSSAFPIYIRLDYERNNKLCGKTIDILRFERK